MSSYCGQDDTLHMEEPNQLPASIVGLSQVEVLLAGVPVECKAGIHLILLHTAEPYVRKFI